MLFEAGSPLNFNYRFLEKSLDCPASLICNNQVLGSLLDDQKIRELAKISDVISFEIEHVNTNTLIDLAKNGTKVIPDPRVLETIQDKGLQKLFYKTNNINTLPFAICSAENLAEEVEKWKDDKFVLKHRKGGYDGKGVQVLDKIEFGALFREGDDGLRSVDGYVIEKYLTPVTEVSVIVCVSQDKEINSYEPCEMVFDPSSNLMDYLISPSSLNNDIQNNCKELATMAVKHFNSAGLFAVELFVDTKNNVYVNEIAPRPHNSGHHSIESCITSQYEQLNRILLGLPLGDTKLICPAITCNIVGPKDVNGVYYIDNIDEIMSISGVYIHMYGKKSTSPFRKLGHFTVISETRDEAIHKMDTVKKLLSIKSV